MELILLIVAVVVILNLFASLAVLRVAELSPSQRLLQLALIWLIPVLGAIVCAAFASSQALGSSARGTIDPLYLPADGGGPDGPGFCGSSGGDGGGDGGGD